MSRASSTALFLRSLPILISAVALMQSPARADSAASSFNWPHGERAAVSLAYDDALDSQLDFAIPTLDKYGLKGSFYLQLSNPAVDKRMGQWRTAAQHGHELGNHTLFHQCAHSKPDREWVVKHRDLDSTSVAQLRDQVILANTMLYAIDGRRERTFTAPCGDLLAMGENYLPAIAAEFVAIKAGNANGVTPAMRTLSPYAVPVFAPSGQTGAQLIAMVKAAGAQGTMINFTFHGIGGDYLTNSAEAHEELVKFLAENRKLYWTDTFLHIMQHVKAEQARTG